MFLLKLIIVYAALGYQVSALREDSDDPDTGGMIRIESFSTHSTSYQILSSMTTKDPDICVSKCLENPECDVTVVCSFSCSPLTECFHVMGNVFRNVCTSNSLTGCYAKPRVTCLNGGLFYNGICHCVGGFTGPDCNSTVSSCCQEVLRSELFSGITGENITINNNKMLLSLQKYNTFKGRERDGNLESIFYLPYAAYFWYRRIFQGQTSEYIALDLLNRENKTYIRVVKSFTNQYVATINTQLNSTQEKKLFYKRYIDLHASSSGSNVSILSIDTDETVTGGSVKACRTAFEKGAFIHVVHDSAYTMSTRAIVADGFDLNVHLDWNLGDTESTSFIIPSYWFIPLTSTSGKETVLLWKRVSHSFYWQLTLTPASQWYVDYGWFMVYWHDSSGGVLAGSRAYLKASVLNGHPIQIKTSNITCLLSNVGFRNEEVVGIVSDVPDGTKVALHEAQILRSEVFTSGEINTCTFLQDSDLDLDSWSGRTDVIWYAESRPWTKIVSYDSFGRISFGSIQDLYESATNMKSLRLVIQYLDMSYLAVDVRNVHIFNSTYIVLDTAKQNSVVVGEDGWICQQWEGYFYSDGIFETVKWSTGNKLKEHRTVVSYSSVAIFSQSE